MLSNVGYIRGRGQQFLVAPSVFRSPLSITRAQLAGVQSSAVNSTNDGLTFYGADVPRFNGPAQRLLIEGQATNLINGMAAPVTQNVTVTAAAHTLTFYGTGSITLSGVATGTLNGTGANDRVTLTFTPTAGTLTLTVSGTVTRAQLELGSFATSYVEVSSGAATRGVDVVTSSLSSLGIASNGACTVLWSGLISNFVPGIGQDTILNIGDNTANNRFTVRANQSASNQIEMIRVASGVTTSAALSTVSANTIFRLGLVLDGAGRFAVSLNAGAVVALTGGTTIGLNKISVGALENLARPMFGEVGLLRVFPYSVSDGDLQSLVGALP